MDTTELTVRDVLNAMIADKSRKVREAYKRTTGSGEVLHCAVGGAASVLSVTPTTLAYPLSDIYVDEFISKDAGATNMSDYSATVPMSLSNLIFWLNDTTPLSKANIAKRLLRTLPDETLDLVVLTHR